MTSYKVSYETDVRPTGLPADAKIEEITLLPLKFDAGWSRDLEINRYSNQRVLLKAKDTSFYGPTKGQTIGVILETERVRETAHALLEAIGEPVGPKTGGPFFVGDRVRLVHDNDDYVGDHMIGRTGEVEDGLDSDGELYVRFDADSDGYERGYYVKPGQLTAA